MHILAIIYLLPKKKKKPTNFSSPHHTHNIVAISYFSKKMISYTTQEQSDDLLIASLYTCICHSKILITSILISINTRGNQCFFSTDKETNFSIRHTMTFFFFLQNHVFRNIFTIKFTEELKHSNPTHYHKCTYVNDFSIT